MAIAKIGFDYFLVTVPCNLSSYEPLSLISDKNTFSFEERTFSADHSLGKEWLASYCPRATLTFLTNSSALKGLWRYANNSPLRDFI